MANLLFSYLRTFVATLVHRFLFHSPKTDGKGRGASYRKFKKLLKVRAKKLFCLETGINQTNPIYGFRHSDKV